NIKLTYCILNYSTCLQVAVQINAMIFFDAPFRDRHVIPLLVVLIRFFGQEDGKRQGVDGFLAESVL
ncbi:MAG: hypothetical protein KHY85_08525, partial [Clostridium sp.]|nr:hypothetical protein [Clostridium sp.]